MIIGRRIGAVFGVALTLGGPTRAQALSPETPPEGPSAGRPVETIPSGEIDRVVASVGSDAITLREVLQRIRFSRGAWAEGSGGPAPSPSQIQAALEELVAERLFFAEARRLSLTVSEADVDRHMEQIRIQNQWSEAEFLQALRMLGFPSLEAYRAHARNELLKTQVLRIKVGSRVQVTDREVEEEFQRRHPDGAEDEIRLAHIVLLVPEEADLSVLEDLWRRAEEIRREAAEGRVPFEELARRHSQDGSASRGGDVGWFTRGTLQLALENVAFSLDVGEISPVVQSSLGFHVLKVLERRRTPLTDPEEARRRIRFDLSETAFGRLYREYLEGLKATGRVVIRGLPGVPGT